MTLPTSITSASSYDAGTDDPKQARGQLKGLHDDVEQINDHLKASPFLAPATPLGIGDGLESSAGNAQVKLQSNPGLARAASGLALDIGGLTVETDPATGDVVALRDASAGGNRSMTLANLLKVINALTEDASPNSDADFLLSYDASAGAVKKVKVGNVGAGGLEFAGEIEAPGNVTTIELVTGVFLAGFNHYVIQVEDVHPTVAAEMVVEVHAGGGWQTSGNFYRYAQLLPQSNSPPTFRRETAANNFPVSGPGRSVFNSPGGGLHGVIQMWNAADAGRISPVAWTLDHAMPSGVTGMSQGHGFFTNAVAITGIRFRALAGNLNGFMRIWREKAPNT